jgi:hypothetical protein
MLQLGHPAVPVGDGDTLHLGVHVVLRFYQLTTVNLQHTKNKDIKIKPYTTGTKDIFFFALAESTYDSFTR